MGLAFNRRLADLVAVIHAIVCLFFFVGAFLAWQYPWVAVLHVPLAVWVSAAFIMGWTCPLTPLEKHFRRAGGQDAYEGGFVNHYTGKLLGRAPAEPSSASAPSGRRNQVLMGVFFCVATLMIYGVHLLPL